MERSPDDVRAFETMQSPVKTVRADDRITDAADLLSENSISAVVVTDLRGKPVGVLTANDIVRYERTRGGAHMDEREQATGSANGSKRKIHDMVEHWMTPAVFSVRRDASMREVAREMVKFGTHHMFVRSSLDGDVLGVISSFDIIRNVAYNWTKANSGAVLE